MLIYKIMTSEEWAAFQSSKIFHGSQVDIEDGFIHFSTKDQTIETANKHFNGQKGLLLVAVDEGELSEKLIYEASRGGQLFPHLYEPLHMSAVKNSAEFEADTNGQFHFPLDF